MEFCKFYTKISQFDDDLLLENEVASDHAEIILKTDYGIISAWNISNPIYHHYFGLRSDYTFSKTHMYELQSWKLEEKINLQIDHIIERLLSGKIDIQIIIEGYLKLYDRIKPILNSAGFDIFYDETPEDLGVVPIDRVNITAIIFNTSKYNIEHKIIFSDIYTEDNDVIKVGETRKTRMYDIPVIYLRTLDNHLMIVGGVHIHGSNSRFPKSGLKLFTDMLNNTSTPIPSQNISMVFMGDFNTIPKNVGDALKDTKQRFKILLTEYPTSVNPGNEVSYYDMTIVYNLTNGEMLKLDQTGVETQALIRSICRSRSHYLKEEKKNL